MCFDTIKGNLGFGCMRLKMENGKVCYDEFCKMIDAFLDAGFNYFDTAHGYIGGQSETSLRDCLSARHKREEFILANKLSGNFFKTREDILPLFESQLELCGVSYFDFYLFHSLNRHNYEHYKNCDAFNQIKALKEQGKIRHIAMSFHDTADVLDTILSEQPDIEAVQLQFNYLDSDDPTVQSVACYEVAVKHGKKVIVMEPVKGGTLANLPDEAAQEVAKVYGGSHASFAIRYAASFPEVFMVLSGMGNCEMMQDNIGAMGASFVPFDEKEFAAAHAARDIIRRVKQIGCTACEYCTQVCPKEIGIPEIFAQFNQYLAAKKSRGEVRGALKEQSGKISECVKCGACEDICPQGLDIRELLEDAKRELYL